MAIIFQHRRDTAANWTSVNPVLYAGQLGFETDTTAYKLGDGTTAWNSLKYGPGWERTAAEIAAGVTPTDYRYDPGDVRRYGANTTPGTTLMTAAIANALLVSGTHRTIFQPETYKTGSLFPPSNSDIYMPPGCVLLDAGSLALNGTGSRLLDFNTVSNCTLVGYGAKVQGTVYSGSEQRHGVNIVVSTNITINGLESTLNGDGDGFYVGRLVTLGQWSTNITLRDCKGTLNKRNGLSVTSVNGFRDIDGTWSGSSGAAIAAGIDIEPNDPGDLMRDIKIIRPRCIGNNGPGCEVQMAHYGTTNAVDIDIIEPYCEANGVTITTGPGIKITGKQTAATPTAVGKVRIIDATVFNETRSGITIQEWDVLNPMVELIRPTIIDANSSNTAGAANYSPLVLYTGGAGSLTPGNVRIEAPYIRDDNGYTNGNGHSLFFINGKWRDVWVNDFNYSWGGTDPWTMNTTSIIYFTLSRPEILSVTGDTALDGSHTGRTINNTGAGGTLTCTLPFTLLINIGRRISFEVTAAQELRIIPDQAGEAIRGGTAGQYMVSSTIGDSCTLEIDSGPTTGQWKIVARYGAWTFV